MCNFVTVTGKRTAAEEAELEKRRQDRKADEDQAARRKCESEAAAALAKRNREEAELKEQQQHEVMKQSRNTGVCLRIHTSTHAHTLEHIILSTKCVITNIQMWRRHFHSVY